MQFFPFYSSLPPAALCSVDLMKGVRCCWPILNVNVAKSVRGSSSSWREPLSRWVPGIF